MSNEYKKQSFKAAKLATSIILFTFLVLVVVNMRSLGDPKATEMDDYFIKNAQAETGSNNVVSSVVFDYRGMDTLGEATVLLTAVLGISLIFTINKNYD